jgi:hypothetical protein
MKTTLFATLAAAVLTSLFAGCAAFSHYPSVTTASREQMNAEISAEPRGDYFIGRRYYKNDYKFWGYVRRPGEPWAQAQLVMLNENKHLAPDREGGTLGMDNGYEYKLKVYFSGETVYEPPSNGFYPEFVLTGVELRSANPGPIFRQGDLALDPTKNYIVKPL